MLGGTIYASRYPLSVESLSSLESLPGPMNQRLRNIPVMNIMEQRYLPWNTAQRR